MSYKEKETDSSNGDPSSVEVVPDHSKTRLVRGAGLVTATEQQKPSLWTKNMFKLYGYLAVATLYSCMNSYNSTVIGNLNGYTTFREYFGFDPKVGATSFGLVYSLYPIGSLVAAPLLGPASDFKGRKYGMFVGALIAFVFNIVSATATGLPQFLVARFMLGFASSITGAAPIWLSEMAHPSYRGPITGLYNVVWLYTQEAAIFIPYATARFGDTRAFRIPLWCQLVFSGLLLVLCPLIPESPRWLVANNREEEAFDIIVKYHGDGDRESPIVKLEYKEMLAAISKEGADKKWWDYRPLFTSREGRYRMALALGMTLFAQFSGSAGGYHYSIMLAGMGVAASGPTYITAIHDTLVCVGGVFGALITDKWGRRRQLLTATIFFFFYFIVLAPLSATNLRPSEAGEGLLESISPARARAYVALTVLASTVYCICFTPLQVLYVVECLPYESRAKGMAINTAWSALLQFYSLYGVSTIGFERCGWPFYFVYIAWEAVQWVVIWWFFVETSQRTLEELTVIFRARRPVATSLQKGKVVVQGEEIVFCDMDSIF